MARGAQLDRKAVAERAGLDVKSIDTYRRRGGGLIPEPDGHIGRSPWWWESTIDRWIKRRRTVPGNSARLRAEAEAAAR